MPRIKMASIKISIFSHKNFNCIETEWNVPYKMNYFPIKFQYKIFKSVKVIKKNVKHFFVNTLISIFLGYHIIMSE